MLEEHRRLAKLSVETSEGLVKREETMADAIAWKDIPRGAVIVDGFCTRCLLHFQGIVLDGKIVYYRVKYAGEFSKYEPEKRLCDHWLESSRSHKEHGDQ